jgi:prophage antirepressor-like protein
MSSLAVLNFEEQEIRFIDGKPVANDVAKVLGYKDPAKTISTKVKDKNKGVAKMVTPGGTQSVAVLEEAGIYQLIFGSKLPSAEKFQDWVFEEVLPAIRENGFYGSPDRSATELANTEWFNRLKLYRRETKIPVGWFSIFEEMCSSLMADFEDAGYSLPFGSVPDISVGLCFCTHLRKLGHDTKSSPLIKKYTHLYPDGRRVPANIYSVDLLPEYRRWFTVEYRETKLMNYFKGKDPEALPSLCKMLGLPEGSQ